MNIRNKALSMAVAALLLAPHAVSAQATAPVSVSAPTGEIKVEAPAPAVPAQPVSAPVPAAPATSEVAPAAPAAPPVQPVSAAAPATTPAEVKQAPPAVPAPEVKSGQGLSAADFVLKPEEMGYGVSLVQKTENIRLPYKNNPVLIDAKDEIKTVIDRVLPGVPAANVTKIAVNIMTYQKNEKKRDFGLLAIEFAESAKGDFEAVKKQVKDSAGSFFKDNNYYSVEKFPVIVIVAHNFPDDKKEDIKWAYELALKKLEK